MLQPSAYDVGAADSRGRFQEVSVDKEPPRGLRRVQDWQWIPAGAGRDRAIQHYLHQKRTATPKQVV